MGEVYRARDTKLNRDVALKVLPDLLLRDSERRARFHREAQILAALNHPNVAAVYGWEDSSGAPALVMELVEGQPLSGLIPRRGMPFADALKLAIQLARGLESAHLSGIVHRDLKPANVMVTSAGTVKILDFGLAKLVERGGAAASPEETVTAGRTLEGTVVGTPAYMSPEQAQGKPVDARSDIFSFGIVLYQMLTGNQPFRRENHLSTLAAILHQEPKPAGEVSAFPIPREAEQLLARALRKDPERRFQTGSDLRAALEDLAEQASSGQLDAAPAARRRLRWGWAFGALALLATGAVAWRQFGRHAVPAAPTLRQLTFEAGMAVMPALSPDGKMLAYVSDRAGPGHADLWIRQMAGGDPHRLTDGGAVSNPQFSPDGTRVYYLGPDGNIQAVPTLGGPPRKVAGEAGPFSVSPDGEIAFVRPGTGSAPGPIQIVPSGGGEPEAWQPDCRSAAAPAWSPDGDRLALLGKCDKDSNPFSKFGLIVAPRHGGSPRPLPNVVDDPPERAVHDATVNSPLAFSNRILWYEPDALLLPIRHGDSVNLYRRTLNNVSSPITQGAGRETWPTLSAGGELVFSRAEVVPTIWSLPLESRAGSGEPPRRESAPSSLFGVSHDGARLVFERPIGAAAVQIVALDRKTGAETVLASQVVGGAGLGSLWTQVSPDGSQAIYKNVSASQLAHSVVSTTEGAPRLVIPQGKFRTATTWRNDGKHVLGECVPGAICELDTTTGSMRELLANPPGFELLYPALSWDGQWIVFMRRSRGATMICAGRVHPDGSLPGESEWVEVSPRGLTASRPRFAPDNRAIYYLLTEGGVQSLVRQDIDPATGRLLGDRLKLAPVQTFPTWFAYSIGASSTTVDVARDRVFYNTSDVRGNVWALSLR